jgi:hypothetical protein
MNNALFIGDFFIGDYLLDSRIGIPIRSSDDGNSIARLEE